MVVEVYEKEIKSPKNNNIIPVTEKNVAKIPETNMIYPEKLATGPNDFSNL